MGLGSGIRDHEKTYSGSRGLKGTGSRIRIRNTAGTFTGGMVLFINLRWKIILWAPVWFWYTNPLTSFFSLTTVKSSVADPDTVPDPDVFGPPGSGSIRTRYGSDPFIIRKHLDSYCFDFFYDFSIFDKWCKCSFKSTCKQKVIFSCHLKIHWRK